MDVSLKIATSEYIDRITEFYGVVSDIVAGRNEVQLGWKRGVYPNREFVATAIEKEEMFIYENNGRVIAAAVVNYSVCPEYDSVDWRVKGPADKISTIHALAVDPRCWGQGISNTFLLDILDFCKERGDVANHLDVIDTNEPALDLYLCTGYSDVAEMGMYYEVVGNRMFRLLEYVF